MHRSSSRNLNPSPELSIPPAILVKSGWHVSCHCCAVGCILDTKLYLRRRKWQTCEASQLSGLTREELMGEAMCAPPTKIAHTEYQAPVCDLKPTAAASLSFIHAFRRRAARGLCTRRQACAACQALGMRPLVLPGDTGKFAVVVLCSRKQGFGPPVP